VKVSRTRRIGRTRSARDFGDYGTIRDGSPPIDSRRDQTGRAGTRAIVQRDLVERARKGDHDAFAVLAGATIGRLDAAARLILKDPYRAQDAVQETLVRCWRDLPTLRDVDRFDAWLHRLFLNACRDELRSAKRRSIEVELPEIHPLSVSDTQSASADRDLIERGVRHLQPEHRTVIVLHYYLGLPLPDAAAAMGVPLGTAKSRLFRATQALRAALDSDARVHPELSEGRSR
jgi:RNA polymerase sigma-70 factor (ECF subfamily)